MSDEENPNGDYMDVCSDVLRIMCGPCPNYNECMGGEPDFKNTNHDQMTVCLCKLKDRLTGTYPEFEEIDTDEDGESTGCCEDVAGTVVAVMCAKCPKLGNGCMPDDEQAIEDGVGINYNQVSECLGHAKERLDQTYPTELKYQWIEAPPVVDITIELDENEGEQT